MENYLPFNAPGFGNLCLPLDCDYVFLVPETHTQLAAKDGQKVTVRIQVEKYLGSDSSGMLIDPKALAEAVDFATVPTGSKD
jgi:hypothetical protein